MFTHWKFPLPALGAALLAGASGLALAQEAMHPMAKNTNEMKFENFPNLPDCTTGSVQQGDPTKGPSFILVKSATGCVIPWHWHTANEQLMIVSGDAKFDVKDAPSITLHAGGFSMLPAKHVHRFSCVKACMLYVYSDAPFDIHYVDAQGKEVPAEQVLKPAHASPSGKG
jgi:quercetin dioxygenase-like cupin family protein